MKFSVHPAPYDVERARGEKDYARHFTKGWETVETRNSQEFCRIITSRVWSPIVFKGGHRTIENFLESRLLALDFDDPGYGLDECERDRCDMIYWLGTTKNHQREKNGIVCDRFRLIIPYTEIIINPHEYRKSYEFYLDRYPADRSAKDQARLFFPCTDAVFNHDGYLYEDVIPYTKEDEENRLRKSQYQSAHDEYSKDAYYIPGYVNDWLTQVVPKGQRNNTWYKLAREFSKLGFPQDFTLEKILTSKTYEGGVPSVSIIKDIEQTVRQGYKKKPRGG